MTVSYTASCACGTVRIEARGKPIVTAACGCDDCQAAAGALEARPGAPPWRDADGTTPFALFHAKKMHVTHGGDRLEFFRLKPGSRTHRAVATCCQSYLYAGFDSGPFWVSLIRARMEPAPPLDMRLQTRFLPGPAMEDVPAHKSLPPSLVGRLSWAALAGRFG
ncbi:GFA family protein [Pseudoroseicyclus tamaricis]|uniref:CENP-V/GFA domain-containing protein n=1 Tax=Pseudoroseicyclus tamaricis TaxID=2705421 RepID=A0A6B2JLR7_9RHOB|nr:hypothetical protein [Pseudoroseicyclus tamaricis]NDU99566.1 hypothetical protein [Pseudoroseicyclus tamaricis]